MNDESESVEGEIVEEPFSQTSQEEIPHVPVTPITPVPPAPNVGQYYSNQTQYAARENEKLAVPAMVCGILSIATCALIGPVAIVLSLKSRKRISESNGMLGGDGMALAGLICGIVGSVLMGLWLLYFVFIIFVIGGSALFNA